MSTPQYGNNMDRLRLQEGSMARPRQRAEGGFPRAQYSTNEEEPRNNWPSNPRQAPMPPPAREGVAGRSISRPTQVPQWPLQASPLPVSNSPIEPYRPPPGSQPPRRPPRPSVVPSILDGSKIQDLTPTFDYRPQQGRQSGESDFLTVPETPSNLSRSSTVSSVGSIPDFPLPVQLPIVPPRKSVNLGPPPSARRGASSFYSNASFVSPIPEESPRSRSRASYASSAAMPPSWDSLSPKSATNYPDTYYDDIMEESVASAYGDDDQDETELVRSASVGKRARPTLVTGSRTMEPVDGNRPAPIPLQSGPFTDGTGYLDGSSSSTTLPTRAAQPATGASMLYALNAASSRNEATTIPPRATPSPQPTSEPRGFRRLSALRKPPRLDIDAVKEAESRGSLTSLSDLIRRATRLEASLEKGRRPASRFDLNDFPALAFGNRDGEKEMSYIDGEKHRSGFSDMLAAFPPPAQASGQRNWRQSIRQSLGSWPLPATTFDQTNDRSRRQGSSPLAGEKKPARRRCCGLPLWGFITLIILGIIIVAAAVIVPLELLVLRRPSAQDQALQQCQARLTCQNGGKNVVTNDFCSCICTNGFTGFDCTNSDLNGCTTSNMLGNTVTNATIGDAIPRLVELAQLNFSIPLSQAALIGRFNSGNLSCTAENALVAFNGETSRPNSALSVGTNPDGKQPDTLVIIDGVALTTITVMFSGPTMITIVDGSVLVPVTSSPPASSTASASADLGAGVSITSVSTTMSSASKTRTAGATLTSTITKTMSMPSATPTSPVGSNFDATADVIDFSRVAVLYILQEDSLDNANTAQGLLQKFFAQQTSTATVTGSDSARNISMGNGNSVNLLDFQINTPSGLVGKMNRSAKARR